MKRTITASCGCEIPSRKTAARNTTCRGCGKRFCGRHLFCYVDESNIAICRNSPLLCASCYVARNPKEAYRFNKTKQASIFDAENL